MRRRIQISGKENGKSFSFEKLFNEQIAWLAGIFQAEAYFFLDSRIRSKANPSDYKPPPPIPGVKLEMIEEDLMLVIGDYLDVKVTTQKRKTTANNTVYRILFQNRKKVKVFLKTIYPFIIGQKSRKKNRRAFKNLR